MRYAIAFAAWMLVAPTTWALTHRELENADQEAAQRDADAAAIDLSGGEDSTTATADQEKKVDLTGCIGSGGPPPGEMSLLEVKSDYKAPNVQAMPPVMRLGPQHPKRIALTEIGTRMGLYRDPTGTTAEQEAKNAAARERKSLHDTYAEYVSYGDSGTMKSGLPMADLFAWVYEGKIEQMAKAYAEYEQLKLEYGPLYEAARTEGEKCR